MYPTPTEKGAMHAMNALTRPPSNKGMGMGEERIYALVLGRVISFERRRRGIDQRAFATALGVSTSAVSRLESGVHTPDAFRIHLVAQHLALQPEKINQSVRAAMEQTERLARFTSPMDAATPWWHAVEKSLGSDALASLVEVGVAVAQRAS
jgi:transcriptional regulator with XRE-family HTH domain